MLLHPIELKGRLLRLQEWVVQPNCIGCLVSAEGLHAAISVGRRCRIVRALLSVHSSHSGGTWGQASTPAC